MYTGTVGGSHLGIPLDHFEISVTEQGLKSQNVAAIPKIGDRERVPVPVWMYTAHAGTFANALEQVHQHSASHLARIPGIDSLAYAT